MSNEDLIKEYEEKMLKCAQEKGYKDCFECAYFNVDLMDCMKGYENDKNN